MPSCDFRFSEWSVGCVSRNMAAGCCCNVLVGLCVWTLLGMQLPLWASGREAAADTGIVVWRLVLLLGFDAAEYMRLEGIRDADALGPKMFLSQSPNKSGMFCVLHFLLSLMDPGYKEVRAPLCGRGCKVTGHQSGQLGVLHVEI
jgi:hypothetical protein